MAILSPPWLLLEGCTVLAFVSMGHDTYSAGVLLLCAIHVPFCACVVMVVIYARLFCLILSSSLVIYYGLAEGAIM